MSITLDQLIDLQQALEKRSYAKVANELHKISPSAKLKELISNIGEKFTNPLVEKNPLYKEKPPKPSKVNQKNMGKNKSQKI